MKLTALAAIVAASLAAVSPALAHPTHAHAREAGPLGWLGIHAPPPWQWCTPDKPPTARCQNKTTLPGANPNPFAGTSHALSGIASFYNTGRLTANGEHFNPGGLTAAHRTLPFGTKVKVTNLNNSLSVLVRINDRGPFIAGRIIDLAEGAARAIGLNGLAKVSLELQ